MKSLSGQPSPTRDLEAPAPRREAHGSSAQSPVVTRSATAVCCLKPRRSDRFVAPRPPHPRPKGAQAFLRARGESVRAAPPKNKRRNPGTFAFYKHAAPLGLAAGCASVAPRRGGLARTLRLACQQGLPLDRRPRLLPGAVEDSNQGACRSTVRAPKSPPAQWSGCAWNFTVTFSFPAVSSVGMG